jgi:hypothetical protein
MRQPKSFAWVSRTMGGGISLRNGADWMTTGWIFQKFLTDVIAHSSENSEVAERVRIGMHNHGLHFDLIEDRALERRTLDAITNVATDTVYGSSEVEVDGEPVGEENQEMYLREIQRLLHLLEHAP